MKRFPHVFERLFARVKTAASRSASLVLCVLVLVFALPSFADDPRAEPTRIISINPSLTAILLALGRGDRLVGVDDFSAQQIPEVAGLPRVGGLFNPSLEAVVALEPDLVVLVPSAEQRDFRERLSALEIKVEVFENHQFDEVLENITRLGALTRATAAAEERVAAINATRTAVERAIGSVAGADATAPTIAMVLQRDPLFVVGGGNFIDTMLYIAGTRNIAAEYLGTYPRVALEWLVAASPEVIVDLSPEARESMTYWERWPNMKAVQTKRLISLDPALISMPGPDLDRSLELLAKTFWGDDVTARIEHERGTLTREGGRE